MSPREKHLAAFLEAQRVHGMATETVRARSAAVRRFFAWSPRRDLRAVTRLDIRVYAVALIGELATGSVWTHLTSLCVFFAWLEETDVVLVNPCAGVVRPKLPERLPRRVLTPGEVHRLLRAPGKSPKGLRDRAIMEVLYSTGLRRAECAALQMHEVDLNNGLVRVTRGKGGKDRIVPLGDVAVAAVRAYLPIRTEWLRDETATLTSALWLSPIRPHQPIKKEGLAQIVRQYGRRVRLRGVSTHAWRHTCATQLVRSGAALPYVQRLLGHRSLMTTQRYARVNPADVQDMLRKKHPRERARR